MVIEKVKQLDEAHARQLLTWLQGQERAAAPARQPAGALAMLGFGGNLAPPPIGWMNSAPGSMSNGRGGGYVPSD